MVLRFDMKRFSNRMDHKHRYLLMRRVTQRRSETTLVICTVPSPWLSLFFFLLYGFHLLVQFTARSTPCPAHSEWEQTQLPYELIFDLRIHRMIADRDVTSNLLGGIGSRYPYIICNIRTLPRMTSSRVVYPSSTHKLRVSCWNLFIMFPTFKRGK